MAKEGTFDVLCGFQVVLYGVLHMGFFLVRWHFLRFFLHVLVWEKRLADLQPVFGEQCQNNLDANLAWHHPLQSFPRSREVESPAPYRHSWRNGITLEPVSAASISSVCPPGLVHGVFILTR